MLYKKLILTFADAIQQKKIIRLTYVTKDGRELIRKCAPIDMAPCSRAKIKFYKFHFWDFDSEPKPHILSLSPDQIIHLELLDEFFKPEEFVTWNTMQSPWTINRDWNNK